MSNVYAPCPTFTLYALCLTSMPQVQDLHGMPYIYCLCPMANGNALVDACARAATDPPPYAKGIEVNYERRVEARISGAHHVNNLDVSGDRIALFSITLYCTWYHIVPGRCLHYLPELRVGPIYTRLTRLTAAEMPFARVICYVCLNVRWSCYLAGPVLLRGHRCDPRLPLARPFGLPPSLPPSVRPSVRAFPHGVFFSGCVVGCVRTRCPSWPGPRRSCGAAARRGAVVLAAADRRAGRPFWPRVWTSLQAPVGFLRPLARIQQR